MPASQCGWGGAPIFQVYGTKRKAPDFQNNTEPDNSFQVDGYPKRRCLFTEESRVEENGQITHSMTGGTTADINEMGGAAALPTPTYPTQQMAAQPPTQEENCMFTMDLLDETYSHIPAETLATPLQQPVQDHAQQPLQQQPSPDAASMAMDTDCVPDPYQYSNQNQRQGAFCQDFCGFGDNSPTSGRIKCFCKPSWEGMLDLHPYISDIY